MEISGVRHLLAHTGDEKYQMLELNKRLETYLNHVKLLEGENHLLWGEIQALRRSQDSGGQRKAQVEALGVARREVQNSWREKDCVELEISNLLDEIEELNTMRQKERAAQAEAKRRLEESRKMLEDEHRMQIWLREKAAHLEREISIHVKVHQEDMAALKSELSNSKPVLMAPQHSQPLNLQGLAQEYSQKACHAWREATGTYQKQVEKLEESLMQSRSFMDQISQEKKESQLQLQGLAKELENMKVKREFLEKNMTKQRDSQTKELQHFQAHIETLEAEKVNIEEQIGELLVDRRNLMQMKMSLGIEVATYRALLDNESLRANKQSTVKKTLTALEGITKTHGKYPGTQTHLGISSSLLSSPLRMTSKSITFKPSLMTQAPSWPLTRSTTQETPKNPKEEDILINSKTTNLEKSPATLTKPSTKAGSQFHYEPNDAHNDARYVAEDKPDSILSPRFHIESDDLFDTLESGIGSQQVLSGSDVIISQTLDKEVSSSLHIADAKCSEDGDEEETEVSAEMAQISHAPMSDWEETDTAIVDDRDVISELESENITETSMQEFRLDAGPTEFKESAINTNALPSSLSTNSLSHDEETREMITWTDVNESVIHFVEEESLKSAPEIERESVQWTEEAEGTDFDTEEHKEMNIDRQVEQRKEEEKTSGTGQQSLTMKVTASMDEEEREGDGINKSTQELRVDAGFTEFIQPGENTRTQAPSLTEDTPLSAHTFSPNEEISEILGAKENIFHFAEKESLKSAPEIERESVEGIKEFEHTGSEAFKRHYYDTEEHKEKREDREVEQRKEEEVTEHQSPITEVTACMHKDEKEVETIINNSTQEFLLAAGPEELSQPGEISPDEETSEILTWADVKESVIHFVEEESLKSEPEIKQQSVEETKEVEGTSTEMFTGHDFDKRETNEDKEEKQRREENETNGTKQQSLLKEVTASMDNNSTQELRLDAGPTECKQPGENAIRPTLSLTEDTPLSVHTFSPDEETSDILDEEENVIHFVEEESLKTELETERESVKGMKDDSNLSEMLKGHDFDFEEHEEKNEDREVEQRKEEKTNGTEQSLIMEVTASMHQVEKEVETIINNSTQEFIQPGENTTTLVEYTPLSTHTFSPDEKTSDVLDGKETVTHFAEEESLNSVPEIETESMEVIKDEDTSEILTWADAKRNVINSAEEESQKSVSETEIESVEGTEEVDRTLTEVLKGQGFGTGKHEEKKEDKEMEQIEEREDSTEQQSLIMDVTASVNNTEKEVETIINNNTQEFRLDTGLTDFKQPNTVTLAPSLTEGTPLSAPTFSSDEETSEILTGADVRENAIHFVEEETLKSALDFERDSMTTTEEVGENTVAELPGTVMWKGQEFQTPDERFLTYSEADDEQSEQRKDEDVMTEIKNKDLTEEVNAAMDNNEKEGMIQSSSDLQGDPDRISENAKQNGMDSYGRNNQLDEHHAEEEHEQSEDESMNISGSWKTDPGETDSYARENTLADTRPLIHYKSEEEVDADTKISHMGMKENNDSEGESEKQEGEGHWNQKIAKRFDTMEDLSEEPEMCNVDDVVTYGLVHTVMEAHEEERESLDVIVSKGCVQPVDEGFLEREVGDTDHGLMDAALVNLQESELGTMEKSTHSKEETMQENTLVDKKHEESSYFQDTREVNEILSTEQSNKSKDDITKDMVETMDIESTEINPEQEAKAHLAYIPLFADTPVSETPQEQTLEEPYELTLETAMIKEQASPKEEDEQSNLSLLTHADLTDSSSQHSGLNSRPESYTADSEQEVSNSSDDESPNASRCSQMRPHLDVPTQQVDWMTSSDGVLENDSEKENPKVEFVKDSHANFQTEELESVRNQNKEEKQCTGSSGVDENAGSETNEYDDVECASHSILSTVQEHGILKTENKDEVGVFQGDDLNESEAREKQNDPHSFFSSSIKEGIWSTPQFEMAATFDPLDQTETEKDSHDSVYPNQSTAFREGLRNLESLTSNNGKPENETRISLAQSVLKEREDQNVPQAKQLQCRNVRDEVAEEVHSGDSTDEGDSWSSGEE